MKTEKILLAGATGYLGGYIARQLEKEGYETRLVIRDWDRLSFRPDFFEVKEARLTKPETLKGICRGVDVVISTVGITRQKDGLTYMDVDYQANMNLILEARASGARKFIYVSVLNGEKLRHLKICEAKEKLVDGLKSSGLDYCVIRPNGFFSDMGDFLKMASKGTVYLFGDGHYRLNPIHGEDLAKICVEAIHSDEKEIEAGGPDVLSQQEIAEMALKALSRKVRIVHLPDWIRKATLWMLRTFTGQKTYGPMEFFLSTMAMDMIAPSFGEHHLEDHYRDLAGNILPEGSGSGVARQSLLTE